VNRGKRKGGMDAGCCGFVGGFAVAGGAECKNRLNLTRGRWSWTTVADETRCWVSHTKTRRKECRAVIGAVKCCSEGSEHSGTTIDVEKISEQGEKQVPESVLKQLSGAPAVAENKNLALERMAELGVRVSGRDDYGEFGFSLGKWWEAKRADTDFGSLASMLSMFDRETGPFVRKLEKENEEQKDTLNSDLEELSALTGIKMVDEKGDLTIQGCIFFALTLLMPLVLIWFVAQSASNLLAGFLDAGPKVPWY